MRSALALLCACTISAQSFSSSVLTLQAKEDPAVQEESRTPKPMPSMPERPEETTDSEESAEQDLAPEARESATSEEDSPEKADQKGDSAGADSSSAVLKTDAQTDWTWLTSQKEGRVLYRLYNPSSGEHFYTGSANERNVLISSGWKDEDTAWSTPVEDGEPVYRLYNPNASDHHYTKSENERNGLVQAGWKDEGIAFYSESEYGRTVYRLYNPNARSGSHHYTLSLKERNALIQAGWKAEGTAFFAISDYDFAQNDNGEIHGFDSDQNELKGRVGIYDDWYEFDETGVLQTGWIEENGQPDRYSMPDGRQLLGFAQVENDRYFFDLETGSMHRNTLEQDENGSEFWFDENGRAVSGRVFVYPKVGQANAEGIVWNTYGWNENPVRHSLLRRRQELEAYRENPEVLVQWNETCSNTLIQDAIAEYEIVQNAPKKQEHVSVSSVYNPNSGEHFYTADLQEIAGLVKQGWKEEGVRFLQPVSSNTPVYRLYQSANGEHHYTCSPNERQALLSMGWKDENIAFYSAEINQQPVLRLYNPNAKTGSHHFMLDRREKERLVEFGWKEENGSWNALNLYSFVKDPDDPSFITAFDPDDQPLYGFTSIFGDRYCFDESQGGRMLTGEQTLTLNGQVHEFQFGSDGKMVTGEVQKSGGIAFYDLSDGHRVKNSFVQYGNPKKVCWYDENGWRVSGRRNIKGHMCRFDDATGALMPDFEDLQRQIEQTIANSSARNAEISFAVRVPGRDEKIVVNSHSQQSASVMKMFVMGAIFENYERYAAFATPMRLEQQLSVMISVSSNDAWVYLVSVLGGGSYSAGIQVLNAWNRAHGYSDTYMSGRPYGNFTSAKDASQMLCDIQEGRLKNSRRMKALLQTQAVPGRLLSGIPSEARTANKPGWLDFCQNDTVLVDAPFGTYVITMLCDDLPSAASGQNLMGQVSLMVYAWMKANMNLGQSIPDWA